MDKKEYKITKRYSRKVTKDFQSYEAMTEMTTTVEVSSAQELKAESDKLFKQVKVLSENDLAPTLAQLGLQ
jgi:hypothetical protein